MFQRLIPTIVFLITSGICVSLPATAQKPAPPDPVLIGMVEDIFEDMAPKTVKGLIKQFDDLVKELTGLNGKGVTEADAFVIAQKLEDKKLHLGVFHGYEYAWVKQKYPNFHPLMIAVYYERYPKAHLVVRNDNDAAGLANLKGKALALPSGGQRFSKLFLEREIAPIGDPKSFFSKTSRPESVETALDEVVSDTAQLTVVDSVSLATYKEVHPGRHKRLRLLKASPPFPSSLVVYRDGVFAQETLDKFKKGMLKAHNTAYGKDLMTRFKITAFEPMPADYPQKLADILRAYPAPSKK